MGIKKPSIRRQKRCLGCHGLFEPDSRTKGKQKYCPDEACQKMRQRKNERNWRQRNPECVEEQRKQSRQWFKAHRDYSRQRREKNPRFAQYNRDQTRLRMQKIRLGRLFDKSKSILLQLTGNKRDKCYLAKGGRWLHLRLTKASPLSRLGLLRDNGTIGRRVSNRLPQGRLYEISQEIFNQSPEGP